MSFEVPPVDPAVPGAITREQEEWFHGCIVAGEQGTARRWLEAAGDYSAWTDRRGRTLAARMLSILGDERGGELLHLRNFRAYPEDATALFYGAFSIDRKFGPLAALQRITTFLEAAGPRAEEDASFSDLWAYKGNIEARFRDFTRAYRSIGKAREMDPEDMWIAMQHSHALTMEDRPGEALAFAEEALRKAPDYWPTICEVSDSYWAQNRDEEAMALLRRGLVDNEGASPARRLVNCFDELEQYEEGLEMLDEFERRSPKADKETREWIEGYRASFCYQLGRGEEMIPHAEASGHGFYRRIAKRVKSGKFAEGRRVRLSVPFVRQNDLTCAPATLTAISQFHGRDADHLGVAEEICYNGTPDYKERLWAEQQGWYVKEFRVDWKTTKALIDAGFPFTLATVEPTSAHLQAVIGYDSRAATIIIRDPGHRHYRESISKSFFKEYKQCGPRGMVLVPMERKDDLDRIALPETKEYDLVYEMNGHLENHDREAAVASLERLRAMGSDHRMLDQALLNLSFYDSDSITGLEVAGRMVERFPESIRWDYALYCRRYGRMSREERLDFLHAKTSRKRVFTLYFKEYAEMLAEDARSMEEARYQFRRAIRYRSRDAEVYFGFAGALWKEREFEQATAIYRIASCLDSRNERYADSFFLACRWVHETAEGLSMLRSRYERLGSQSGGPAITYAGALRKLDRDSEVADLLEEALMQAPEDGELLSYAADFFAVTRHVERAQELVARAEGRISEVERWRVLARIEDLDSRPAESLHYWKKISEAEPLAMDAHRAIASLLNRVSGSDEESVRYLQAACERHPYHVPLHECLVSWLRDRGPGAAEETLRSLLDKHPSNAWAWRELALDLGGQLRYEEALEAAQQSIDLCPEVSWSYSIRGVLLEESRHLEEARDSYRKALELDIENSSALRGIVDVSEGIEAKRKALQFIESQLQDQVLFGDTIHAYRRIAFAVLEPEELLQSLRRANEARPDLWETWSALIEQFSAMSRWEEAEQHALELTKRFPVMPRAWLDLAGVYMHLGDREKEIETLEKCLTLNPQWAMALRRIADALESRGEYGEAVSRLERALREDPLGAANYGCLADLLWKTGRRDEAFDIILRGARIDPSYGWGWDRLGEWAGILDRREEALEEGRRLTRELPFNAESWQRLAYLYGELGTREEQLEVLEEGLGRLPLSADLRDLHAWLLCDSGRYRAALGECSESRWPDGKRPRNLAGREAWIEYQRGRPEEAIRKMSRVVEEHPDYYWAHENLIDWHIGKEEFGLAEKSARQLVRLAPMDPEAHGNLAELLMKQDKTARAREELERAFGLAPDYAFAGYHLVRIDLEAKNYAEAEETLRVMEFHHPGMPACGELRCRLEAGKKDPEAALAALAELCRTARVAAGALERIEQAMLGLGKRNKVVEVYEEALLSGEVKNTGVPERWISRVVPSRSSRKVAERLTAMPLEGDVYEAAWQGFAYELENLGKRKEALAVIRKYREIFHGNTFLWASAAYLLRQAGRKDELRRWMADWRAREGLRPWMLINLALNELSIDGFDAAGPVHIFAADDLPEEQDTGQHCACASFFETTRGDPERAGEYLERAESGPLPTFYRGIAGLARLRIDALALKEFRPAGFAKALAEYPQWSEDSDFRIYVREVLRHHRGELLRDRASRGLVLRAIWKSLRHLEFS